MYVKNNGADFQIKRIKWIEYKKTLKLMILRGIENKTRLQEPLRKSYIAFLNDERNLYIKIRYNK